MKIIRTLVLLIAIWTGTANAQTFADVPSDYWAHPSIETLAVHGITAGCGNENYCPEESVTRAQMAVFLERGMNGSSFTPPPASGNVFLDIGAGDFAAAFIEQLYSDGITAGCGNNNFCPDSTVTRDQMAVFLLRAKYGAGYSPPSAVGIFNDVDLSHWAVHWIEQLAAEDITAGCGNNNYCPEAAVSRAQMAVFLVRTFGLVTPGTLTLFKKSSSFFNPTFDEVPLPYSSNSSIAANVNGIPPPTTYTLNTFKLAAVGQAFTITNLSATDATGQVAPYFSGLSNGYVLADGEELTFELVSPLTGGAQVLLSFSFDIAETGETFLAAYTFTSN
jgi:hypothetical protein